MNYFLAVYLGISIVTIFTNNTIQVFAVESNVNPEISYIEHSDYNVAQDYYQQVSSPLEMNRQKQEAIKQQAVVEETNRQLQIAQLLKQQQIVIQKKKIKPKLAAKVNYAQTAPTGGSNVESLIYYWTSVYGGDPGYHVKIAKCESGLNPGSVGGGGLYLGVYQQHSKYWPARAAKAGFAGASPFDANANVAVSIQMMRAGGYGHWGCA